MLSVEMHRTLLETKLSIPRVNIFRCENCGDRERRNSLLTRPHSVHVDQGNHLYLQHINEVELLKLYNRFKADNKIKKPRPRTCHFDAIEHVYEEVKLESVMETLDIRINHRKRRIRRESEAFTEEEKDPIINTLESDNSEKADEEFQFFESC